MLYNDLCVQKTFVTLKHMMVIWSDIEANFFGLKAIILKSDKMQCKSNLISTIMLMMFMFMFMLHKHENEHRQLDMDMNMDMEIQRFVRQ